MNGAAPTLLAPVDEAAPALLAPVDGAAQALLTLWMGKL